MYICVYMCIYLSLSLSLYIYIYLFYDYMFSIIRRKGAMFVHAPATRISELWPCDVQTGKCNARLCQGEPLV